MDYYTAYGKRNQHGPPLIRLMVFGIRGIEGVREWVETWGGAEGPIIDKAPDNKSKNLWVILRSVVFLNKQRQKENDTCKIR